MSPCSLRFTQALQDASEEVAAIRAASWRSLPACSSSWKREVPLHGNRGLLMQTLAEGKAAAGGEGVRIHPGNGWVYLVPLARRSALRVVGEGPDLEIAAELCDDRLLVKPVPAALALLPDAPQEPPYPGAKPMLLVEEVEDGAFLRELLVAMEPELPAPKPKKPMAKKE